MTEQPIMLRVVRTAISSAVAVTRQRPSQLRVRPTLLRLDVLSGIGESIGEAPEGGREEDLMSAAIRPGTARARQGEDAALRNVIERLRQQFPELDSATVARTVHGRYEELDDAPVRDFIPVLIERSAREQLRTAADQRS